MISRSSWTFWKACSVLYNPSLNLFLRFPLELYEKVPWSWVKILTKLGKNFTKCLVSWPYVLKIITWDTSTFGRSYVKKKFIFNGDIQLLCCKFLLNHLASWWKFGSKLWKNMEFLSLEILTFQNEILTFQNEILTFWFIDE